jgi:Protein of unknown function (DUF3892)
VAVYITAIRLEGGSQHQHITRVRWQQTDEPSETGEDSRQQMVDWIRNKNGEAYVRDDDGGVSVLAVDASPPYLRTYADGKWTDNLLALSTF